MSAAVGMCGCGCGNRATVRRGRVEDFAELRSWGLTLIQAAERLGVSTRTAERYAAELQEGQPKAERVWKCKTGHARPVHALGLCSPCYGRWTAAGRPSTGPPPPMPASDRARVAAHARWAYWRLERSAAA